MKKLEDILHKAAASRLATVRPNPSKASSSPRPNTSIFSRLAQLYQKMEQAYSKCAQSSGLSCAGCEQNCCTSFFQHHTYIEWAYLWRGLQELPSARRKAFLQRSREYVEDARQKLTRGELPTAMCPLNEDGLCGLYAHRLMICRLHGTRNSFTLPDGSVQLFPGCHRFTALPCAREGCEDDCPTLDRTPLYRELALLELEYLQRASSRPPQVDMTLAEMIVAGPPKLP